MVNGKLFVVALALLLCLGTVGILPDDQPLSAQHPTGHLEPATHIVAAELLTEAAFGLYAHEVIFSLGTLLLTLGLPLNKIVQGTAIPPQGNLAGLVTLGNGLADIDVGLGEAGLDVLEAQARDLRGPTSATGRQTENSEVLTTVYRAQAPTLEIAQDKGDLLTRQDLAVIDPPVITISDHHYHFLQKTITSRPLNPASEAPDTAKVYS